MAAICSNISLVFWSRAFQTMSETESEQKRNYEKMASRMSDIVSLQVWCELGHHNKYNTKNG